MPSCSVKWCANHTSTCSLKSKNGVSFHRFPKDEVTCQKWVEAVRLERNDPWWTSSNASRICSIHFKETDISSTPCNVNILAKTAVPICTMVWYDKNENNFTSKTSIGSTVNTVLKTYERKKTNMNVLKESKVNLSYNWNNESSTRSNLNTIVISNITQDSVPQGTKLLKTLEVSKTQILKDQKPNRVANINLKTNANVNVTPSQKKTVLTEFNKKEYDKSCKDQCCKSKILVKLNDNTNLILDEDLSNDSDIKFKESNKVDKEPNTRTSENSKKITLQELKSNENKEPNHEVTNMSNPDMFVRTITNGNVELNASISKSYVGKMLKTYLPNRKDKVSDKNIKETSKLIQKNKSIWKESLEKGLNTVTYKEVNITNVNKYPKYDFNKKLNTNMSIKNNIMTELQSNKNSQEKKQLCVYKIVKRSNLLNRPKIKEQNKPTVAVKKYIDGSKELNIAYLDELISSHSKMDNIKETDATVYDEIISELFETSKKGNKSDESSNGIYQESNENICIESETILGTDNNMDLSLNKETNNMHVMLDLDKNIYIELNKLMDLDLCSEANTGLNDEINREVNTNKISLDGNLPQFNENTAIESNQHMSNMNKNMPIELSDTLIPESHNYFNTKIKENSVTQGKKNKSYNENITNNDIILSNNELQNLDKSVVNNIVTEAKKDEFTELKRYLSMKPKLDFPSDLCTSTLTDIQKNLFSRYDNIMSTTLNKENIQGPDRDHNSEFDKNTDMEVNDTVTSLHINNNGNNATDSNVTSYKQFTLLEEFITNITPGSNKSECINYNTKFNTGPNATRTSVNNIMISDINMECKKICGKDMPDLNTVMNLGLCSEESIGFNDEVNTEFNTDEKGINAEFNNENTVTQSNQSPSIMNRNMPTEHSDHLIAESRCYLPTEIKGNITTNGNENSCYNETITSNALILSNNEIQNFDTSVVNSIVAETKIDEFTGLKKHLSTKLSRDSFAELCTKTQTDTDKNLFSKYNSKMSMVMTKESVQVPDRGHNAEFDTNTQIDVNDMVTSLHNNINTDATKETESKVTRSKQFNSILLKELIPNISPELNNTANMNFIHNSKISPNTTRSNLNNKIILDSNIECKKIAEKDMPDLNTLIISEVNEDQVLKSKEVINKKYYHINTTAKDLVPRKSYKDFVNVLTTPDDQHTVVNKHMDVVDSILNRDIAAEFDLSLLLSDTPIPDEEIQNVDNSNNNSLDGIDGSPNWIHLPTSEMPKIIDDILEQNSPFFENLDLFDKVNKLNMDKEANKKDNEIKKLIKEKYPDFEQLEEQIINNFCDTDKRSTKNSVAQIKKQLMAELSDYNDTSLEQSNNICIENTVNLPKKVPEGKCKDLCGERSDKHILEQHFHPNNEQRQKFNLNEIVDQCSEHSNKEIQDNNKTINLCQKQNNIGSKANKIEDLSSNKHFGLCFKQSEKSHREQDGLGIDKSSDKVLNDVNILELSKKQYDKESNEQTFQSSVGELRNMEESTPKSKIHNQGTLELRFQKISKQISEDFNKKRISAVDNVSSEAHTPDTENVRELNIGQLKRSIFEQCYDPECQNDCKNQKHNSNTESYKKDVQPYNKQTNFTPCQPDIEKRDLLYKRQCNQTGTDNLKKQINKGPLDANIKQMKNKCFLESHKMSYDEKCETKYKKIAIDHIPGKYLELRWKESKGKSNPSIQEGCKRKHKELGLDQRKILCRESTNKISQQIMEECPECGYTTDDNDLMNYKSDVDLRITKPLSLINKDMLISLRDIETENNGNNRIALDSVYAMELAYVTAIQALERKLKQKIAISEYRLRRVNNLSKINNTLIKANFILRGFTHENKM